MNKFEEMEKWENRANYFLGAQVAWMIVGVGGAILGHIPPQVTGIGAILLLPITLYCNSRSMP
jgi:predicted branched-subunit amino acid permease